MPKKILATTIIIVIAIEILSSMSIVSANFIPTPALFIQGPSSPTYPNGANYTFTVEVHISMDAPAIVSISYCLDDGANITSTDLGYTTWSPISANLPNNHKIYSIQQNLDTLGDGNHTLKVYSVDAKGGIMSATRTFTIDRNFKVPAISIISPLNQSYSKNEIPLTYSIDAQIKWAVYYLDTYTSDSYRQHMFNGNITLSQLPEGPHSIKLEVLTEKGTSTQITYFNIDTSQTSFQLSQTTLTAIAIVIAIVAVASASLFYFRRRGKLTNKQSFL